MSSWADSNYGSDCSEEIEGDEMIDQACERVHVQAREAMVEGGLLLQYNRGDEIHADAGTLKAQLAEKDNQRRKCWSS